MNYPDKDDPDFERKLDAYMAWKMKTRTSDTAPDRDVGDASIPEETRTSSEIDRQKQREQQLIQDAPGVGREADAYNSSMADIIKPIVKRQMIDFAAQDQAEKARSMSLRRDGRFDADATLERNAADIDERDHDRLMRILENIRSRKK